MSNSQHIAKLPGSTIIVMKVSEAINAQIRATVEPTQIYLDGALRFVAGLTIRGTHNHWTLRGLFSIRPWIGSLCPEV